MRGTHHFVTENMIQNLLTLFDLHNFQLQIIMDIHHVVKQSTNMLQNTNRNNKPNGVLVDAARENLHFEMI